MAIVCWNAVSESNRQERDLRGEINWLIGTGSLRCFPSYYELSLDGKTAYLNKTDKYSTPDRLSLYSDRSLRSVDRPLYQLFGSDDRKAIPVKEIKNKNGVITIHVKNSRKLVLRGRTNSGKVVEQTFVFPEVVIR